MSTLRKVVVPEEVSSARKYSDMLVEKISKDDADTAVSALKRIFLADSSPVDHRICEERLAKCLLSKCKLHPLTKAIALSALTHANARLQNKWAQIVLNKFLGDKNPNNREIADEAAKLN